MLKNIPYLALSLSVLFLSCNKTNEKENYSPINPADINIVNTHQNNLALLNPIQNFQSHSKLNSSDKSSLEQLCDFDYDGWDQKQREVLLDTIKDKKVVMFGIDHGAPDQSGDKRDGEFVAELLPFFKSAGYTYVAIEAPYSLNKLIGKHNFEEIAQNIFLSHWVEFGPVIKKARDLNLKIIFYDADNWNGSYNDREQEALKNLKEKIFSQDKNAKVIFYCGAKHLYKTPISVDFLNTEEVKTIGYHLFRLFNEKLVTVYLQPEQTKMSFAFDYSLYLGKQKCN